MNSCYRYSNLSHLQVVSMTKTSVDYGPVPTTPFSCSFTEKLSSPYCLCSLSLPPQPPYLTSVEFFSSQSSEAAFVKVTITSVLPNPVRTGYLDLSWPLSEFGHSWLCLCDTLCFLDFCDTMHLVIFLLLWLPYWLSFSISIFFTFRMSHSSYRFCILLDLYSQVASSSTLITLNVYILYI